MPRPAYTGLTWDHPRGRRALDTAAEQARALGIGVDIDWHVHPLEGFESTPITQTAQSYDLIVMDHPHLGEATTSASLQPIDALFDCVQLDAWRAQTVGPAYESYVYQGRLWALPLDVATQVAVRRADLVAEPPRTWDEVTELAGSGLVGLSLAGPHAFLCLESLCVSLGEPPGTGAAFIGPDAGRTALATLSRLAATMPPVCWNANPIGLLEAMSTGDEIGYIPLIYGYVNYAAANRPTPLRFTDVPVGAPGGRHGSVLGGTGVAVTSRCAVTDELRDYLRWLLDPATQCGFIPDHEGQPSATQAWHDDRLNTAYSDFYAATATTIDECWIRPRHRGAGEFQTAAAHVVRDGLRARSDPDTMLADINQLYERSLEDDA